jgi:NDP-sugar pyrophosphorylase family protein
MKFILLAAGQGKRLRPYTDFVPKCMVKFNDKSIVDYILDTASKFNFDKTIIVNGYKKEVLEEHLKDKNITFYTNDNFEILTCLLVFFMLKMSLMMT